MSVYEIDPREGWANYYALRNWARLTAVAVPIAVVLIIVALPKSLMDRLIALPRQALLAVVLTSIGIAAVVFAVPVLRWARWKCPRCGESFALPTGMQPRKTDALFVRLLFKSQCANCRLPCGAEPGAFLPYRRQ